MAKPKSKRKAFRSYYLSTASQVRLSLLPSGVIPPRKARSREGAVQIAAFFPEEVRAQLKVLAAEQRRDIQDLMGEALNLIFVKYGKAEIAPRKAG